VLHAFPVCISLRGFDFDKPYAMFVVKLKWANEKCLVVKSDYTGSEI